MLPSNSTSKTTHKICVTNTFHLHNIFVCLNRLGLYLDHQNYEISTCVVFLVVSSRRNFVVYPADKYHCSVLHMVRTRATFWLCCTRVQLFADLLLYERYRKCIAYCGVVTFLPSKSKVIIILGLFGYFVIGDGSPILFGLGRGPITPPGPAMVWLDRKDLNSSKTKNQNQNNAKICPKLHASAKTMHWVIL